MTKRKLTSGKCYKTIYFQFEITVLKQIHLTKCDVEKRSNVGQNGMACTRTGGWQRSREGLILK